MLEWITYAIYTAMLLGLFAWFVVLHRRHLRRAAKDAREKADLHRKLAEANKRLAQTAFDDDHGELAKGRFELADIHSESMQAMLRAAEGYDELAQWPVPRWLGRRTRETPER